MKLTSGDHPQGLRMSGRLTVYNGSLLLIILPFLPLLSGSPFVKWLGYVGLSIGLVILATALRRRQKRNEFSPAHLIFLCLLPLGIFGLSSIEFQALSQVLQISLVSLVISQCPSLTYSERAAVCSLRLCFALLIFSFADLLFGLDLLSGNPNLYGVAAFCWAAVILKAYSSYSVRFGHLRVLATVALPFMLAFASGSRASLSAIFVMVAWVEFGRLPVIKWFRPVGALFVICAPIVLLLNADSDVISSAMEFTPSVGEKHTLSGRDAIWSYIYSSVSDNGFMGFGLGSMPGDLQNGVNDGLSAHNGFFQIFYQFGVLGFGIYIFVLAFLIKRMSRRSDGGVSASILLGAIVLEMFEVVMTQNHFGAGLSLWAAAALCPFSLNRGLEK